MISLAGRHAVYEEILFSYFDNTAADISTKGVIYAYGQVSLRITPKSVIEGQQMEILNNNPGTEVMTRLYDVTGRLLLQLNGKYSDLKERFNEDTYLKPNNIYFLEVLTKDGNINLKTKLYKS